MEEAYIYIIKWKQMFCKRQSYEHYKTLGVSRSYGGWRDEKWSTDNF